MLILLLIRKFITQRIIACFFSVALTNYLSKVPITHLHEKEHLLRVNILKIVPQFLKETPLLVSKGSTS